jgi:uncharacterized protein
MAAHETVPGLAEVRVERDVECRMRDGTVLRADVYRPVAGGDRPVLLHRSPYDKQIAQSDLAYPHPAWYAAHGYVVVAQDVRGRWRSDGDFYPFLHEADDGWDTVEWAARLPGCDGRVAMYGFSYSGATQLLAAAGGPPSLAAVCPALTASQFYEGWTYRGGALAQAFVSSWAAYLATGEAVRRGDNDTLEGLDAALLHAQEHFWADPAAFPHLAGGLADYYRDWLAHPTYDDYWRRWSIDTDYGRLEVPALHIGGLYDSFLSGTVRNFVGMRRGASGDHARERQKLLIAPFTHMPWWPVWDAHAAGGANAVDDWQLRYLAEVLDGRESGVFDHPVTAWVLGHGWRDFGDWPPPEASATDLFLHSGGRANTAFGDGSLSEEAPAGEQPDFYTYHPAVPAPTAGGHSCCVDTLTPMGPARQAERERQRGVLVYTSAPFPADLDVVGDVTLTLHAVTSTTDTDWTSRLCLVDSEGSSRNLQEGVLRAAFRESASDPSPVRPGQPYKYRIDLGPVSARVPAGSRLRLQVSSSDFPQWARNMNTGWPPQPGIQVATQTVLHDDAHPSRLTVPLVQP